MLTSLTDVTMPQWQVTSFIEFTLVHLQCCAFDVPKAIVMFTSLTDVTMSQWQVTSFIDCLLITQTLQMFGAAVLSMSGLLKRGLQPPDYSRRH